MRGSSSEMGWIQAGIACLVFYFIGLSFGAMGYEPVRYVFWALIALVILMAAMSSFRRWRLDRELDSMLRPVGVHGAAVIANEDHIAEFGLAGPLDGSGLFLGALGNTLIVYKGKAHVLTIAPTTAGKSASVGMNNCLTIRHSLFVTDKSGELAVRTYKHRAQTLKQDCYVINPWRLWRDQGLPNHHLNPLSVLVRMAEEDNPEIVDETRAIVERLTPEKPGSSENPFFTKAARDLLSAFALHAAFEEATTGRLCCNLPALSDIVCGSVEDLEDTLVQMRRSEVGRGIVRKAAGRIDSRIARSPKTFENILAVAQNALVAFDQLGPLGQSMEVSDFDIPQLKDKPTTIYLVIPGDKLMIDEYGVWVSLIVDLIARESIRANTFHPRLTMEMDEFGLLCRYKIESIKLVLMEGASLGVQWHGYVQDWESLKAGYDGEAKLFESQCQVIQTWGTTSSDDARWIEDHSGQTSILTESVAVPTLNGIALPDGADTVTVSEQARPVIRKDQALQLGAWRQFIRFQNNFMMVADLVSFEQIDPLRDQVTQLPGDDPAKRLPIRFYLNEKGEVRDD